MSPSTIFCVNFGIFILLFFSNANFFIFFRIILFHFYYKNTTLNNPLEKCTPRKKRKHNQSEKIAIFLKRKYEKRKFLKIKLKNKKIHENRHDIFSKRVHLKARRS